MEDKFLSFFFITQLIRTVNKKEEEPKRIEPQLVKYLLIFGYVIL